MVKVVAISKGYDNIAVREVGEVFDWPGEKIPGWTRLHAFGGKGDHDGDGRTGGSLPSIKPDAEDNAKPAKGKRGRKAKDDAADEIEPFGDAPEPVVMGKGNGVADELGSIEPDWVPPSAPKAVDD